MNPFKKLLKMWNQRRLTRLRKSALSLAPEGSPEYRSYLETQFDQSFGRRQKEAHLRCSILARKVSEFADRTHKQGKVLCVGARNGAGLDALRRYGFEDVRGIDLYSEREDILVMDMHHLTFPADSFDVIYSSHSLEHSRDVPRVLAEMHRVAKRGALLAVEVPVAYEVRGADRHDFVGVPELHAMLGPHIVGALWSEAQDAYTDRNDEGTPIIRTVCSFRSRAVYRNDLEQWMARR